MPGYLCQLSFLYCVCDLGAPTLLTDSKSWIRSCGPGGHCWTSTCIGTIHHPPPHWRSHEATRTDPLIPMQQRRPVPRIEARLAHLVRTPGTPTHRGHIPLIANGALGSVYLYSGEFSRIRGAVHDFRAVVGRLRCWSVGAGRVARGRHCGSLLGHWDVRRLVVLYSL
jgi:hypothetical protein